MPRRRRVRAASAMLSAIVLSGCAGTSFAGSTHAQTPAPSGTTVPIAQLAVGDCFGEFDRESDTSSLAVVPCDDVHIYEVFAAFELPEGDYPSKHDIDDAAFDDCDPAFAEFIGIPSQYSVLEYFYFAPTKKSWAEDDDHGVACVVGASGITVAGSLRGYRR
ncbi:septum formation family protein [Microbacterium fluvii]|uniref:Septum formation family protein n=1 Tax=Microbacterium fluvii TaxID=415215 RepID=A0ABW2HFU3_9MICO|nr:septum formation family protein [Microbacterium fluvii]MCU4673813.1 septum formation family protein [Microbacterium fluvii]